MYIFGRKAEQCKNQYKELKKNKDITIQQIIVCKDKAKSYRYIPHFYLALTNEQKDSLFENKKQLFDKDRFATLNMISEITRSLYYSPLELGTKALIIYTINQKIRPLDDEEII